METVENDAENCGDIALKKTDSKLTSILKPSQKENQLSSAQPPQLLTPTQKIKPKVSFKNTPQHRSPRQSPIKTDSAWNELRELDEAERWTERTQVVTKEDHLENIEIAKSVVETIIDILPVERAEESTVMADTEQVLDVKHGLDDDCNEDFIAAYESEINNASSSVDDMIKTNIGKESFHVGFDDDEDVNLLPDPSVQLLDSELDNKENEEECEVKLDDIKDINVPSEVSQEMISGPEACVETIVNGNSTEEQVVPESTENLPEIEQLPSLDCLTESQNDTHTNSGASDMENLQDNAFTDEFDEDEFKSAEQVFSLDIDYLEKFGHTDESFKASALARQSLYVKFDPLVKMDTPPEKNAVSKASIKGLPQRCQGDDLLLMNTPPKAPYSTAGKFAAVLSSSVPVFDYTPPETTGKGIDKLLTFSPAKGVNRRKEIIDDKCAADLEEEHSAVEINREDKIIDNKCAADMNNEDDNLVAPLLYTKSDIDAAVKKERVMMEKKVQEMQEKITGLNETIEKLQKENACLGTVMGEYELTMTQMIESADKEKKEYENSKSELIKEKDQVQGDLHSVETAFGDLHRRYEKLKGAVEGFKKNEETLKKAVKDYQEKVKKAEERYGKLKEHAESKIESANIEINKVRKSYEGEVIVLKAAVKKECTRVSSLEKALEQKDQENKELTAICDELINKMQTK